MKEKISNEQREKIIARNRDRAIFATLLRDLLSKYTCSQACVECGTENPLFDDSCNYIGLRHELSNMAETFEKMAKYEEVLLEQYYE